MALAGAAFSNVSTGGTTAGGKISGAAGQAAQDAKLRSACAMFESYFLKEIWKAGRGTLSGNTILSGGQGEKMFTDMLDQTYADQATKGRSVGLADMMMQQLAKKTTSRPSGNIRPSLTARQAYNTGSQTSSQAASGELVTPVAQATVTSEFGPRVHPVSGREHSHSGLDLAAAEGSDIQAAAEGVVSFAGVRGGYGNLIVLDHADGRQTYYGHCREIKVAVGQKVAAGQVIGSVGQTGVTTGPHLHFEVRNAAGAPTDPLPLLAKGVSSVA